MGQLGLIQQLLELAIWLVGHQLLRVLQQVLMISLSGLPTYLTEIGHDSIYRSSIKEIFMKGLFSKVIVAFIVLVMNSQSYAQEAGEGLPNSHGFQVFFINKKLAFSLNEPVVVRVVLRVPNKKSYLALKWIFFYIEVQ